jgi:ketosteroid isomerase-like protein
VPSTISARDLQKLERRLYDAMIDVDFDTLDKLLSDDLQFIHSDATVHSKAAYFQALRDRYDYRKIENVNATFHGYAGAATVLADVAITGVSNGNETQSRMRVAYVWVEEPQGWRLVLRQATRIS